jgi:hypothetical protein
LHESYGGPGISGTGTGGCCAAPYTITVTVNGFTYTQTESSPYINYSYLISGLSSGLAGQDQVYQGVSSSQCYSVYALCTNSYILAYSTQTPFVPSFDFSESITASAAKLDPGSNVYFLLSEGGTLYSGFYGSISTLSVNATPLPAALPLFATGLGVMGLLGWRRKRQSAAPGIDPPAAATATAGAQG